ncbi:MAG: hypothetical protein DWQ07_19540 [Chloroflexi bacterium]|nr:MAG: hypothetical protein DWQ07_19540 [Chloroflexota bacterium]MBL1194276.1 ExeM/NucH family extracellular endonuclease [Chloroflexota bacterium]NOH11566.1 ExeM/NucH family extracellular endonuclease [Chloroflexota bacterium]
MQLLRTRRNRIVAVFLILSLVLSVFAGSALAATSDLLFSEYIEGSSFNKALEIYNGTGASVDLSQYTLELYSNGSATPSQSTALSGSLADGDVYVISHASADAAILAEADATNSSVVNFNGDDAVVLRNAGGVVDSIGQVGFDPGSQWGTGNASTQDNTIRRMADVCSGDTDPSNAYDPGPEWDGFANNDFSGIGAHTANCGVVADDAPSVSSTTPVDTATDVAVDANIIIDFSEAVDATGSWFDITCAISGAHTAVASGGPNSFTLDPDADFANSESCTVTVFAAQVTDQDNDDPPDNMAADSVFSFTTVAAAAAPVVINELLADPAGDLTGDANGDGVRDSGDDEFVEIVNVSGADLDISGWTLSDGASLRHTFPAGSIITNQCSIVLFGGGSPTGTFGGALIQTASTGAVGLNNSGDTITLNDGVADIVSYVYGSEGGSDQSLTRDPDITGADPLVQHSTATGSGGAFFSPGTQIDGALFAGCTVSESAPSVATTTPADTATDIAVDSNIDINFSEDVNVAGAWFDVSCVSSGAHTSTVSGGPQSFTLDPDTDFDNSEVCTVTVFASQVTDVDTDDPPDNMAADYVFSFTTVADTSGSPVVINELLADPAGDITGDANGDGTRDGSQDEFVEIVNVSGAALDVSGWTLSDGFGVRHTFPAGSVIANQCSVLVFGGGTPTGSFGGSLVQTASGGLVGLNNGGDTVTLNDGVADVISYTYGGEGGNNQSLTRDPDITGADPLVQHSSATGSAGALFSPGTFIDGSAFSGCPAPPSNDELLLSEIVVTPTGGEFVEIHNPTGSAIDLTDVYLTDATFAGGGTYYYNIVTGANAGGGSFGDFHARFPAGASIAAGAYQTVALNGSANFMAEFGAAPDYELFDDTSADGELVMLEAFAGSINGQGGLSNGGEVVILYKWDGQSDLVTDLDYVVWGDKAEAVDKTGVSVDGPDADAIATAYQPDTAIASQDVVALGSHSGGNSWQRDDINEGAEATSGGNGINGEDETSEDLSNTWCENVPTPGAEGNCGVVVDPPFGVCLDPATLIHDVQGNGTNSPLLNTSGIIVEGIVIGDYQDTVTELAGFYIQEEDAEFDADATTSEGIFINDNGFGTDVMPGDVVRVQGTVLETFGLTQLGSITNLAVCSSGATASETTITLPLAAVGDWEFVEGMLVTINQELTATGNFTTGRFGEVDLSVNGRLFNPTNVTTPGAAANALQDLNNRSRILLDDASTISNPLPLPPYLGPDNTIRAGDTIPSLTGVLTFGFSSYRMQPVGPITFTRVNDRQAAPTDVGGTLKVASFNVLNYFTTIDTGASICGPGMNLGCRGADTPDEFIRQRDKVISAITTMDVDVIGINEIENNTITAIQDLVDGLNAVAGAGTYSFIDTGTIGTDAIRVAIIYKPAKVTPVGAFAVLDSSVDPLFLDTKNRPALAQTFEENATGAIFTVAVNHFKSKGSACDDVGDPDAGDGQGNCNGTRTDAATALVNWLATDPTGSGDPDFLITGDLNAYAMEDPVTVIKNAGYTNLIESYLGLNAYSFVFFAQAGYLDHALTTPSLTAQVSGLTEWHINADEPAGLDYNNFNQPLLYNPDPYRASDHDPVIIGLELDIPPVAEVSDFVVLADESTYLQYRAEVNNGDVGANNASSGPFIFYHDEVVLSYLVKMLDPASRVLGDDVRLQYGAQAYDVYYNDLTNQGNVLGTEFTPVNLPLVSAMPDVPSFTPGTQTVIVGVNQTVTLAPGDYGKLYAFRGSTVILSGGDYTFENWLVARNAEVVFDAASNVNIEKRLYTSKDVYIGPSAGSGITAADIRIIVTGQNGDSGHLYDWPKAVFIGFRNTVEANIYAPNGLLWLYSRTEGTGSFIGKWVLVGDRVKLTHDSGW